MIVRLSGHPLVQDSLNRAGIEEEGLLEVLLVAGHSTGEVEGWCWIENELEATFYRRSKAVAENEVSPASNYGEAVVGQVV